MFKINLLIFVLFFSYFSSSKYCDDIFAETKELTPGEVTEIVEIAQREEMNLEFLLGYAKHSKEVFADRMDTYKGLKILLEHAEKSKDIFAETKELTIEEARKYDFFVKATALTPEEVRGASKISKKEKMDVEFLLGQTKKAKEWLFLNLIKKYDIEDIKRLKTEKVANVLILGVALFGSTAFYLLISSAI